MVDKHGRTVMRDDIVEFGGQRFRVMDVTPSALILREFRRGRPKAFTEIPLDSAVTILGHGTLAGVVSSNVSNETVPATSN